MLTAFAVTTSYLLLLLKTIPVKLDPFNLNYLFFCSLLCIYCCLMNVLLEYNHTYAPQRWTIEPPAPLTHELTDDHLCCVRQISRTFFVCLPSLLCSITACMIELKAKFKAANKSISSYSVLYSILCLCFCTLIYLALQYMFVYAYFQSSIFFSVEKGVFFCFYLNASVKFCLSIYII